MRSTGTTVYAGSIHFFSLLLRLPVTGTVLFIQFFAEIDRVEVASGNYYSYLVVVLRYPSINNTNDMYRSVEIESSIFTGDGIAANSFDACGDVRSGFFPHSRRSKVFVSLVVHFAHTSYSGYWENTQAEKGKKYFTRT